MRRGGGRDTPPGWGWGGEKHRPVRAAFRRCRRRPGPEQGVTRNGTEARHADRHAVPAALWQFLFLGALTGIPCLRVEGAMMAAYHVTGVGWQDGGRFCRGGTNGPPGARDGQSRRTYRTSICTGVRTVTGRVVDCRGAAYGTTPNRTDPASGSRGTRSLCSRPSPAVAGGRIRRSM